MGTIPRGSIDSANLRSRTNSASVAEGDDDHTTADGGALDGPAAAVQLIAYLLRAGLPFAEEARNFIVFIKKCLPSHLISMDSICFVLTFPLLRCLQSLMFAPLIFACCAQMYQIRGFAVLAHILRNRDPALITEDVLAACVDVVTASAPLRMLWIRGLRFLLCDRRLWCSTSWNVKIQVRRLYFLCNR